MELVPPITLPQGHPAVAGIDRVRRHGHRHRHRRSARSSVVQVAAPDKLLPQGSSVYSAPRPPAARSRTAEGVTFQQGYLEQSNVDMDTEVSDMETAEQAYEMGSRAVQMEGSARPDRGDAEVMSASSSDISLASIGTSAGIPILNVADDPREHPQRRQQRRSRPTARGWRSRTCSSTSSASSWPTRCTAAAAPTPLVQRRATGSRRLLQQRSAERRRAPTRA